MSEQKQEPRTVSRRDFVKGAAVGAAALAGAGALGGCSSDAPAELPKKWDEETDVVVIGTGFAGLAAAIEAAEAGASVKVLEKMEVPGGNSAINGGAIAVPGSPRQAEMGIEDSAELMYQDMLEAGLYLNHRDLARRTAEKALETWEWTVDHLGVEYREGLTKFGGHSVARSYGTAKGGGAGYTNKELAKAKEVGAEIRTGCMVTRLIQDPEDGRIKGVQVRDGYTFPDEESGEVKFVKAKKAVILASGGYGADLPMRTVQDPRLTDEVDCTNHAGATGEMVREALRVDGNPVHLTWIQLGPWASPDEKGFGILPHYTLGCAKLRGVQIDPETGKRFVNEMGDRKECADAILEIGHPVISIVDSRGIAAFESMKDQALEKGVLWEFDTIDALIDHFDINEEGFKEELERWNSFVEQGVDEDFGKAIVEGTEPIAEPPFYACRTWPKVHHTMGGVQTNMDTQVLDLEGSPIEGLYAAGEVVGGIHGACRLGSVATSECLTHGRIAGQKAAAEESWA
jgi:flavocytochrome c